MYFKCICRYIRNTPYLRQMILAVREWLIYLSMTWDLHNYTVSLLVLFYLQTEKYAVSVNDLKFDCNNFEQDPTGNSNTGPAQTSVFQDFTQGSAFVMTQYVHVFLIFFKSIYINQHFQNFYYCGKLK